MGTFSQGVRACTTGIDGTKREQETGGHHMTGRPKLFADVPADIMRRWNTIQTRCTRPNSPAYQRYGAIGIHNQLTPTQLHTLWIRDNADEMHRPSVDRINSDHNYTLENCRIIELSTNRPRPNHRPRFQCPNCLRYSQPKTRPMIVCKHCQQSFLI